MKTARAIRICAALIATLVAFAFVASDTCARADLIPGMVSYWQFEEGGGTTAFDSVGTNNGAVVGDPDWIAGQVGGALDLDDDDYVRVPHDPSLNPGTGSFTFTTWIKPPEILAPPFQVRVIFKVEVGPVWLGYNLDFSANGNFSFCLGDGTQGSGVSGSPCGGFIAGNWYHVAAVRDRSEGKLKFYVNGVERESTIDTTGDVSCVRDLIIGKRYEGDTDYTGDPIEPFIGALDEVAIFDRALSGCEICGMYTNGLAGEGYTVTDPPLVNFPDAALKAVVEEALGIENPTRCNMLCLTKLGASGRGIEDLTGLEYAKNLKKLVLENNQISDLTPLSGLTNLKELNIANNRVSNITPVSGLTNLTTLNLTGNQINDITPLSGLSNLTKLELSGNQVSDIRSLSGLTNLEKLQLNGNRIVDISALSELSNLVLLDLRGNPLNCRAYRTIIPIIVENNPGINIRYDPMPPECLNQPPVANAGPDQTVEQESHAGTDVTLNGSGSTDPDSAEGTNDDILFFDWYEGETHLGSGEIITHTFQLGTHSVRLVVTDKAGATDDDEVVIVVQDTTPPVINSISANPSTLWPANHKMVEVMVTVDYDDICDPAPVCRIVNVTCNEPINGPGDGNTEPDWQITGDLTVKLRAERAGSGTGRVYTVHVECRDVSGSTASATVDVTVPHDKGKGKK